MLSKTVTDRLAGLLLLALLAVIIVTLSTMVEVDPSRDEIRESLQDIVDNRNQYLTSVSFDLLSSLLTLAVAGALYLVFRPHHRALALFGAFGLLAAGVTSAIGQMTGFALHDLAQEFADTQAEPVLASARAIALVGQFAFAAGFTFLTLGLLAFGALIAWSGAVPRLLGLLLAVGAVLMLLIWLAALNEDLFVIFIVGSIVTFVWLLLTGGWLILRGTREAPAAG